MKPNVEALTRLRDLMLEVDGNREYKKHFDPFYGYGGDWPNGWPTSIDELLNKRDSTACALGWAVLDPWFRDRGFKDIAQLDRYIDEMLPIEWYDDLIFNSHKYKTPNQMAKRIDYYLDKIEKGE